MNEKFEKEFLEIRDESLTSILAKSNNWNSFINYWARNLDNYSVDNILNLYSYNSYGQIFHTFDEWNSEKIDRRIKL